MKCVSELLEQKLRKCVHNISAENIYWNDQQIVLEIVFFVHSIMLYNFWSLYVIKVIGKF